MIKGKIKTIPLKNVVGGQQVYWIGNPSPIKLWPIMSLGNDISLDLDSLDLNRLVIEYDDDSIIKQIPLKDSEWETAVKLDLINSNKLTMFNIVPVYIEPPDSIHCNRGADVNMAVFISMESWDAVFERFNKMYPTFPFKISHQEWLKANFKDPIPL